VRNAQRHRQAGTPVQHRQSGHHHDHCRQRQPDNIRNWAKWVAEPIDQSLLAEVQAIFAPVKNLGHAEGLAENN